MILQTKDSDILNNNYSDIVFAINKEGFNDSGFAGTVCRKGWSELANFGQHEIGSVFSKKIGDSNFHAIVCHSLEEGFGDNQEEIIKECFDKIETGGRTLHCVAIGTGLIGILSGAKAADIFKGIQNSKNKVVLHTSYTYEQVCEMCDITPLFEDDSTKEKKAKDSFNSLREHIGKEVEYSYLVNKVRVTEKGILKEIKDYSYVGFDGTSFPFLGYNTAIVEIKNSDGKILFNNPLDVYKPETQEDIGEYQIALFGRRIANIEALKAYKEEIERKEFLLRSANEAVANRETFINEGKTLIDPSLFEQWSEFVTNNTTDGYSACIIEASISLMKKIEEGLDIGEAEELISGSEFCLSGYQFHCIQNVLSTFYKNADKYKRYHKYEKLYDAKRQIKTKVFSLKKEIKDKLTNK